MFRIKIVFLLTALTGMVLLGGCGSSGGGSGDGQADTPAGRFGVDPNGIIFTGSASCIACHQDLAFSAAVVARFQQSKHMVHSTQVNAASPALCLDCHDPIGEGRTLESLVPSGNIPADGLAAVGCENCHGAGGEHFGLAPIVNASPDFVQCGQCHAGLPAGPLGHSGLFAGNILENYQSSAHADSLRGSSALCDRCHSDEGFRAFIDQTAGLDSGQLATALTGVARPTTLSAIQCRTCHDSHSGELRVAATSAVEDGTEVVRFSREFNLCTGCHQVFLSATFDPVTGSYAYLLDATRAPFHGSVDGPVTAGSRVIWDTHFAYPAGGIAGYSVNAGDEKACTLCHDPHGATRFAQADAQTIAEEWGASGHADYQGKPFSPSITRAACFKCHSGTEYSRFVQGVVPADLDTSEGARVIACVACHDLLARDTDGQFALGALRQVDAVTFPSGAVVSLGGPSNLCMNCHQGSSSTPTVNDRIAAVNLSFSNIHNYAAAATLFGGEVQGGYEYAGRTYRGRNSFPSHTFFGAPELTDCTGCHLGTAADHRFSVPLESCTGCHTGGSLQTLSGSPRTNFAQIAILKDQLLALLTASGVQALASYPYFGNITSERQLKAAYNWQVADKEPGGYVHNGIYIRQLLYDSIIDMGGTTGVPRP
ncbi:hypothetical protein [Trichloromonas sp.]|uniref:hypothetical protein n=1 Tax=Trichloromonas sp. TaxID=3069249 RepID=UPI003D812CAF